MALRVMDCRGMGANGSYFTSSKREKYGWNSSNIGTGSNKISYSFGRT
jgi:hypothetical protein